MLIIFVSICFGMSITLALLGPFIPMIYHLKKERREFLDLKRDFTLINGATGKAFKPREGIIFNKGE